MMLNKLVGLDSNILCHHEDNRDDVGLITFDGIRDINLISGISRYGNYLCDTEID